MIIDIHAHIWRGNYENDKRDIIKACKLYDITKVYICSLGVQYPDKEEVDDCNYNVYKFMHEFPQYIGGLTYVNPSNDNCLDVLKRGIEEYGMSGMKLWIATFCDDPKVFPLIEKCIDYKIPILIHSFHKAVGQMENETTGPHVANLAKRYPEAKIIMAHLGANCYHGIKAIRNYPNVCVDISGSIFRRDDIDYTKKQIGASRILFGTDMTGSFLVNQGQIEEADLTDEERDMIYYKNVSRLLERK